MDKLSSGPMDISDVEMNNGENSGDEVSANLNRESAMETCETPSADSGASAIQQEARAEANMEPDNAREACANDNKDENEVAQQGIAGTSLRRPFNESGDKPSGQLEKSVSDTNDGEHLHPGAAMADSGSNEDSEESLISESNESDSEVSSFHASFFDESGGVGIVPDPNKTFGSWFCEPNAEEGLYDRHGNLGEEAARNEVPRDEVANAVVPEGVAAGEENIIEEAANEEVANGGNRSENVDMI